MAIGEFERSLEPEEDVESAVRWIKSALGEPQSTSVNITLHHVKGEDVGIPAASRNKKVAKRNHRSNLLVPGGGVEPPRAEARRILRPSTPRPKPRICLYLQRLTPAGALRSVTFGDGLFHPVGHKLVAVTWGEPFC